MGFAEVDGFQIGYERSGRGLGGAGHICNADASDEFNDALRRFLEH